MLKKIIKFMTGLIILLITLIFFVIGTIGVVQWLLGYYMGIDEVIVTGLSYVISGIFAIIFHKMNK